MPGVGFCRFKEHSDLLALRDRRPWSNAYVFAQIVPLVELVYILPVSLVKVLDDAVVALRSLATLLCHGLRHGCIVLLFV